MRKTTYLLAVLILSLLLAGPPPAEIEAQSSTYRFTAVARVGDLWPSGGMHRLSCLGRPQVNNQGELLFQAGQALYLKREAEIRRLTQRGDASPSGPAIARFWASDVNDRGEVLLRSRLTDGQERLFLYTQGRLRFIVASGDPMPTGGRVNQISTSALNQQGEVAFFATVRGGSSATGIFRLSGGEIQAVVVSGQASPVGGVFQYRYSPYLDLNDRGEVVFEAQVSGGRVHDGLFLWHDGLVQPLVTPGETSPLGGQFEQVSWPQVNNRSQVLFEASLSGASAGRGIFMWEDGVIRKVVASWAAAPIGGRFNSLDVPIGSGSAVVFLRR